MTIKITEELREEVREAMLTEDESIVCDILDDMDVEWVRVYDGLDELFDDYCGGDVEEILNLWVGSRASIDSCASYYVKDGYVKEEYEMSEDIDWLLDDDDFIDSIIEAVYNNVLDIDFLNDIVHSASCEWQDVQDALGGKENDLMREAIDEIKEFGEGEHINEFLGLASRTHVAWCVVEYLDKTHFCGIDESRYVDIVDHFENGGRNFALMVDEVIAKAVNGITIEKATEMYVKKHWM